MFSNNFKHYENTIEYIEIYKYFSGTRGTKNYSEYF
jgi:hypothetical protein